MADVEVILETFSPAPGDVHAANNISFFDNTRDRGFVGKNLKTDDETSLFLRFDHAVPATATLNGIKLQLTSHSNAVGGVTIGMGLLLFDGKWDVNGFSTADYNLARDLPHVTGDGNDAIIDGRMLGNVFMGGAVLAAALWTAGAVRSLGFGSYTVDHSMNNMLLFVGAWISGGSRRIGIIIDPIFLPAGAADIHPFFSDHVTAANRPKLFLDFTTLAPVITSGNPATAAFRGETWNDHAVTATDDPLSVPLTFTLDDGPRGMTIDATTGVVSWVDTAQQPTGDYVFNVRVANIWGDVDTQQLTVHLVDRGVQAEPSETTIANAALVLIGERRISSLDERSKTAKLCKDRFADVRDDLLRAMPWIFATKRVRLAADAEAPLYGYGSQATLPNDCLRLLTVDDEFGYGYVLEGRKVLTHIRAPLDITYIARVTNPKLMDVLFRQSFAAALAVELAEPLTGSSGKLELVFSILQHRIRQARTANGQESLPLEIDAGEWERSRGREDPR